MKLLGIFQKLKIVIKWGAVVMAVIKAIETLTDELDKLEQKDDSKT